MKPDLRTELQRLEDARASLKERQHELQAECDGLENDIRDVRDRVKVDSAETAVEEQNCSPSLVPCAMARP
jgi:uncharacterized protein YlxW (UPF0749 family)